VISALIKPHALKSGGKYCLLVIRMWRDWGLDCQMCLPSCFALFDQIAWTIGCCSDVALTSFPALDLSRRVRVRDIETNGLVTTGRRSRPSLRLCSRRPYLHVPVSMSKHPTLRIAPPSQARLSKPGRIVRGIQIIIRVVRSSSRRTRRRKPAVSAAGREALYAGPLAIQ